MKKLNLLSKVCYVLGFIATMGSIVMSLTMNKEISWQIISLIWMANALISDMRIKQLEDKL